MPITWQAPGVSCGGTFDIKVELGFEAEVVVVCGGGQGGSPRPIVEVTVVVRADESACPSDLATARTPTSRIETTATARSSTSESLPEASVQPPWLGGREMDTEIAVAAAGRSRRPFCGIPPARTCRRLRPLASRWSHAAFSL